MKSFKQFIREETYYHGTSPKAAANIQKNGISTSASLHGGEIFLTTNHAEAHKYAKIASGGKYGKVLKVKAHHLDKNKIKQGDHKGIIKYSGNIHKDHIEEV